MNKVIEERTKRTEWYRDARFGMFIHWGLYAIPARGEWVRSVEQIPHEDYCHLTEEFTAENYNPREWARLAKKAGMKYAVLTAKHHDGFCLFDTKLTDYNSMNAACHKDLVKEFLEAFRAEGIKVGLYFSIIDWRHPDFRTMEICTIQCATIRNAPMKIAISTVIWNLCLVRSKSFLPIMVSWI